jgi:hypothetical protein
MFAPNLKHFFSKAASAQWQTGSLMVLGMERSTEPDFCPSRFFRELSY